MALPEALRVQLPNDVSAPSIAREHASRVLAGTDADTTDAVVLLVSELVTNAVRHSAAVRWLAVDPDEGHIRVEVADASPTLPMRSARGRRGLGLVLVERLSDAWGIDRDDHGKVLWSVVDGR